MKMMAGVGGCIQQSNDRSRYDSRIMKLTMLTGTGTPTGDPIEAEAVGTVFGRERSTDEPLFLSVFIHSLLASNHVLYLKLTTKLIRGSIKANIGHLEGSSGPAGVVKAVMMLERGIIPPQALFETLNPAIDAAGYNLKVFLPFPGWENL